MERGSAVESEMCKSRLVVRAISWTELIRCHKFPSPPIIPIGYDAVQLLTSGAKFPLRPCVKPTGCAGHSFGGVGCTSQPSILTTERGAHGTDAASHTPDERRLDTLYESKVGGFEKAAPRRKIAVIGNSCRSNCMAPASACHTSI